MKACELRAINLVSGLEAAHGGPTYSVPRLNDSLRIQGVDSIVLADMPSSEPARDDVDGIEIFPRDFEHVPGLRKLHFSRSLAATLLDPGRSADLIHVHGLWRMQNAYGYRGSLRRAIPLVVSPRGMLSPAALAMSKRSKIIFEFLIQSAALRRTTCFHATSYAECQEIWDYGLDKPVAMIPNGVDLPPLERIIGNGEGRGRYVLSLGRLHPKKALDVLIRAWARVEVDFPKHSLKIVGPSEGGYDLKLRRLADDLGLSRVHILPAVAGEAKLKLLREADIFALTTLNENFGNTVAESLACCVPVISTKGAPWGGLVRNRCGWWVDHEVEEIAGCIREGLSLSDSTRAEMGARGRQWMETDYSWTSVGIRMAALYGWLVHGGERPDFVYLDGDDPRFGFDRSIAQ